MNLENDLLMVAAKSPAAREEPVPKLFRHGTHRTIAPADTLSRVQPVLAAMGITRVANVTNLDRVGVPVVTVCRPKARSVVMAHGKGLDLAAAKASGVMESIELYHAEHMSVPLKLCSYDELCRSHIVADVISLLRMQHSRFHRGLQILWVQGHDLVQRGEVWLPYETVHMNWVIPVPSGSGCFPRSSTGLASGNHRLEAISHALCEIVERDAITLWLAAGDDLRANMRIDLNSIGDPSCLSILEKIERAGLLATVWDATSDIAVPTFVCTVTDPRANCDSDCVAEGTGCHPAREVALLRALTEALQSRVVRIAGARDGRRRSAVTAAQFDVLARLQAIDGPGHRKRAFGCVPTFSANTINADVAWLLDGLDAAGLSRVIVVDLTLPELAIPVVRVVIPGMEDGWDTPDYVPGPRALRTMQRAA